MAERRLTVTIVGDAASALKSFRQVDDASDSMGARVAHAGRLMAGALAVAGTAAVGFAVASIKAFADFGDQVFELSQKTGFTTETLSELSHAAALSGTSLEGLEVGVRKLQKSLFDAQTGGTEAAANFAALGLNIEELTALNAEDQFLAVAGALAQVADDTAKAALATAFFGRQGTALLPMLADGIEGLNAMRQEARDLGIVLDEDAARAADEFNDTMTELQGALRGLQFALAEELIPTVQDAIEWLIRLLTDPADTIARAASAVFDPIIGGIESVINAAIDGLNAINIASGLTGDIGRVRLTRYGDLFALQDQLAAARRPALTAARMAALNLTGPFQSPEEQARSTRAVIEQTLRRNAWALPGIGEGDVAGLIEEIFGSLRPDMADLAGRRQIDMTAFTRGGGGRAADPLEALRQTTQDLADVLTDLGDTAVESARKQADAAQLIADTAQEVWQQQVDFVQQGLGAFTGGGQFAFIQGAGTQGLTAGQQGAGFWVDQEGNVRGPDGQVVTPGTVIGAGGAATLPEAGAAATAAQQQAAALAAVATNAQNAADQLRAAADSAGRLSRDQDIAAGDIRRAGALALEMWQAVQAAIAGAAANDDFASQAA